jgi:hypothetical protein
MTERRRGGEEERRSGSSFVWFVWFVDKNSFVFSVSFVVPT